jgi:hypothetical protein
MYSECKQEKATYSYRRITQSLEKILACNEDVSTIFKIMKKRCGIADLLWAHGDHTRIEITVDINKFLKDILIAYGDPKSDQVTCFEYFTCCRIINQLNKNTLELVQNYNNECDSYPPYKYPKILFSGSIQPPDSNEYHAQLYFCVDYKSRGDIYCRYPK